MGIVKYDDAFQVSLQNLPQELLTRDCFHFLNPGPVDEFMKKDVPTLKEAGSKDIWIPNDLPPNEYSFEGQFVSGLQESTAGGHR